MLRSLLSSILLLACAACGRPDPAAGAAGPTGEQLRAQPISGTSPFEAGCAPEPVQAFGEGTEDAEMETHLAVNPADPSNLVAVWMQDLYSGLVSASSSDGGAHWTVVPIAGTSSCSGGDFDLAADPTVSFGPDGIVYLGGFSLDLPAEELPLPSRTRLFASRSSDGGRSWAPPVEIASGYGTLHDMPAVVADPRKDCTAYLTWTDEVSAFGPVSLGLMFARTTDCGGTWSAPVEVFSPTFTTAPFTVPMGSKLLPMKDGGLVIVSTAMSSLLAGSNPELPESGPDRIVAFRSPDGGASWSDPQPVADFGNGPFHDPETDRKVLASPYLLTASVSADGAAYVAWRNQLEDGTADIRLVRTDDAGASWSAPIVVRAAGTQMMTPAVAAGPDGAVAVTYYDIRNDALADQALWADVWISRSLDRGAHWSEQHLAGPFDLGAAAYESVPVEGLVVGEYSGLVTVPGGYAATFALSGAPATAGASDVFFAPIPGLR